MEITGDQESIDTQSSKSVLKVSSSRSPSGDNLRAVPVVV
jgi:hypothetical protein